jgi:predicted HicB family RNase H-like nuclease
MPTKMTIRVQKDRQAADYIAEVEYDQERDCFKGLVEVNEAGELGATRPGWVDFYGRSPGELRDAFRMALAAYLHGD